MESSVFVLLVDVSPEHAQLVREDRHELARVLNASIPEDWPMFAHAFASTHVAQAQANAREWGGFFFVDTERAALVGNGGFKGPPDNHGRVEIGYEIAPAYRRRGYATAATLQLVRRAFSDPRVLAVKAHTRVTAIDSAGVLRKCGFVTRSASIHETLGSVLQWEIAKLVDSPTRHALSLSQEIDRI